jgi:spore coat polysaccharide biosynthesis predicted glycosyltransferase SpsG
VLSIIPEFTEHVYLKVTRMLEDTKGLIGRKTHNTMVKEKKVKMINNDLQNTTQKTKIQHQVNTQVPQKDNQFLNHNKTIGYLYCILQELFGDTKVVIRSR